MHTPARILRAECDDVPGQRPSPSFREQEARTRILDCAQRLMANHGRGAIRLTDFALAMRMAPQTIRRHFPDMDNLLAEILHRHLQAIVKQLAKVPLNAPDRARMRRAAYLAATRTPLGAPREAHLLLIRDRHLLPPDELEHVEAHRHSIGDILAGPLAQTALALLDLPDLSPNEVEAALSAIIARNQAASPRPPRHVPRQAAPTPGKSATPSLPNLTAAKRPPMGPH